MSRRPSHLGIWFGFVCGCLLAQTLFWLFGDSFNAKGLVDAAYWSGGGLLMHRIAEWSRT